MTFVKKIKGGNLLVVEKIIFCGFCEIYSDIS